MYQVQFPGLGLTFDVSPVAFRIGGHPIMWYGIIIAVGFLLAVCYALISCKKMRINSDKLMNCIIAGMIGGLLGARLYYVLFCPSDLYIRDPLSALYIWDGGLAIYGGVIGGLLVGAITAKLSQIKIAAMLDVSVLGFLIGQCIGRWGNFTNQEAFGTATDLPWGMMSSATNNVPVHPCFLYESLWCLLGFLLLHLFTRKLRRYDGQTFLLYLAWYGLGRFFIEGLRTDSLLTPGIDLRVSQVFAALTVLASLAMLLVFMKKTSLTGCGSKKVMAMNAIVDEIPEAEIDDGVSTIFPDSPVEGNGAEESSPEISVATEPIEIDEATEAPLENGESIKFSAETEELIEIAEPSPEAPAADNPEDVTATDDEA